MKPFLNITNLILFAILLFIACGAPNNEIKTYDLDQGLMVNIEQPAGDYTKTTKENFLPPPFNIGNYGNNSSKFIVLSNRMSKGKSIRVKPIASIELIDSLKQSYIIAIPVDSTERIIKIENYGMLATGHPEVMNLIEYWVKGNHENQNVRVNWTSEQKALDLMD